MPYTYTRARNQYANDMKSVNKSCCAVPIDPDLRASDQFAALPPVHGLDRRSEPFAAPSLHFDEGNFITATHDQIEITMPAPKTMRDKCPTIATQPARGDTFSL